MISLTFLRDRRCPLNILLYLTNSEQPLDNLWDQSGRIGNSLLVTTSHSGLEAFT